MGAKIATIVFQPPEVTYLHGSKHIKWLKTAKGVNIPAFFIDRKAKVTVLFSHGNAEDIGMIYEWFCDFASEIHVNLLAYDYEGYGKASGSPSEQNCYDDIEAAFKFLTDTLSIPSEHIVLYGRSLGSGPTCYLAERLARDGVKLGGIILQSPILSVFRVAFNMRFTFACDMFSNIDRIGNINCPCFVIHGTKDEVVPFWNGESLFFAAPVQWRAKPYWVDGGGHNNIESLTKDDGALAVQIKEFLLEWVPVYGSSAASMNPISSQPGILSPPSSSSGAANKQSISISKEKESGGGGGRREGKAKRDTTQV